jgi:predicted enzyme related to lactoylglutathione lyase
MMKKQVIGIGGIFFKSKNPKKTKAWYARHLGFNVDPYGACFEWRRTNKTKEKGWTVWSPMGNTDYMKPSRKEFMINLIVEDLDGTLNQLKKEGIRHVGEIQEFDYGRFAHIMDPDGIKIELWQPAHRVFAKMVKGKTTF